MKQLNAVPFKLILLVTIGVTVGAKFQQSLTENFKTSTFKDGVNITVYWNTDDSELKLFPFSIDSEYNYGPRMGSPMERQF